MTDTPEKSLDELVRRARHASTNAYIPYSHFPVGAVVVSSAGNFYEGCNVENASYGLTICAERNAIFRMIASGDKEIATIVVFTPTNSPSAPCGACRQVIAEFGLNARVICVCDGSAVLNKRLTDLLPNSFGIDSLNSLR